LSAGSVGYTGFLRGDGGKSRSVYGNPDLIARVRAVMAEA